MQLEDDMHIILPSIGISSTNHHSDSTGSKYKRKYSRLNIESAEIEKSLFTGSERLDEDEITRPNISYVDLIIEAILSSETKMLSLSEIYESVANKYEYYRDTKTV